MFKMASKIIKNTVDFIFNRAMHRQQKPRLIERYPGYATADYLVVRGRVLTALRRNMPKPNQSKLLNIIQMISLFLTDEVADVTVISGDQRGTSDAEGYFQILVPRPPGASGWIDVPVHVEGEPERAHCPVFIPPAGANLMIISDVDDTVIETGAYSLVRNLWTSLSGNALTRRVFPDTVALIKELSDGGTNPVYYVSSSPWNLFIFLQDIFTKADLVKGPMFLREIGLGRLRGITGGHHDHKGAMIDQLLASNESLPVALIGDTAQKDADIYRQAIARHPGRVRAVLMREGGTISERDSAERQALLDTGVEVIYGQNFEAAIAALPAIRASINQSR